MSPVINYSSNQPISKLDMSLDEIIKMSKLSYRKPRRLQKRFNRIRFGRQNLRNNSRQNARWTTSPKNTYFPRYSHISRTRLNSQVDDILLPEYHYNKAEYGQSHGHQSQLQALLYRQQRAAEYLHDLRTQINLLQSSTHQSEIPSSMNTMYSDFLGGNVRPVTVPEITDDVVHYDVVPITDGIPQAAVLPFTIQQTILPEQPKKKSAILKINILNQKANQSAHSMHGSKTRSTNHPIDYTVSEEALRNLHVKQATTSLTLHQRFANIISASHG